MKTDCSRIMPGTLISRREFIKRSGLVLTTLSLQSPLLSISKHTTMIDDKKFDAIIIGGSYSGLSAAMSLGRALRKVLIIDSGLPCNSQTPYSHNFITHDGKPPKEIADNAKKQVLKYDTVRYYSGLAVSGTKTENGFEITTQSGEAFSAKKLIFASGVKDIMPDIKGFSECWGISILHCPYCHGYEVKQEKTGILGNGDLGFELSKMITNWTKDLTLFTNGTSTLTEEQTKNLVKNNVKIIETEIDCFEHKNGKIQNVIFKDNSKITIKAMYAKPKFIQHSDIPISLGCELTEQGLIKTDTFQKTTVKGVFASGDSATFLRAVAVAVSTGNVAGAVANREIIEEEF
jgi:thioredoxin reductase